MSDNDIVKRIKHIKELIEIDDRFGYDTSRYTKEIKILEDKLNPKRRR